MFRSNSDTTTSTYSPAPTSPFSSNLSVPSEPTSDETPDLGAFTTVLREWNHLQPLPRLVNSTLANAQQDLPSTHTLSSFSSATRSRDPSHLVLESDGEVRDDRSTVWAQRRIASYLNYADTNTDTETDRDRPVSVFSSETIGEAENELPIDHDDTHGLMVPIQDIDELDSSYDNDIYDDDDERRDEVDAVDESDSVPQSQLEHEPQFDLDEEDDADTHTPLNLESFGDFGTDLGEQPSLGYLDEALKFIAAERERFHAQREAGTTTVGLAAGIEPRKRRRRKRTKTPRAHSTTRTTTSSTTTTGNSNVPGEDGDPEDPDADADADESSSSYDQNYSSNYSSGPAVAVSMFKSVPGTPGAARRRDRRQRQQLQLPSIPPQVIGSPGRQRRRLRHSRSTPQLGFVSRDDEEDGDLDEVISSPRIAQLRALGKKLESLFPEDVDSLRKVRYTVLAGKGNGQGGHGENGYVGHGPFLPHSQGKSGAGPSIVTGQTSGTVEGSTPGMGPGGIFGGFIDTRGPLPLSPTDQTSSRGKQEKGRPKKKVEEDERLIHVFVDHSNILIGLINYLKRYPQKHPQYRDFIGTTANGNSRHISSTYPKPPKHLSHSALTLILERGRPVTRRVLVTSSPLYQPMEGAAMLGYDVKVFARVPDYGDGMDRERDREREKEIADKAGLIGTGARTESGHPKRKGHKRSVSSGSFSGLTQEASGTSGSSGSANDVSPKKGRRRAGSVNNNGSSNISSPNNTAISGGNIHRRKSHKRQTSGSNSTESEQGASSAGASSFPQAFARSLAGVTTLGSSAPTSGSPIPAGVNNVSSSAPNSAAALTIAQVPTPQRIRYREQGVDELLQLKLHQVLAALDGPPPSGSTIVLVTGDGNAGQFNEDGFLGGVRTALKKGWKVELYAWEGGLSRAWNREFGEGSELGSGFKIIGLEQFGTELVEIYY